MNSQYIYGVLGFSSGSAVKNPPAMQETPWRRDRLPTPVFFGFPCGSAGKESTCNTGDLGSIPGLGRSPGEGKGYPLQYSCLENSMDRGAWWATVQGIAKNQTRLKQLSRQAGPVGSILQVLNILIHLKLITTQLSYVL